MPLTCMSNGVLWGGVLGSWLAQHPHLPRIELVGMVQRQHDKWPWTDKRRKFNPRYDDVKAALLDRKLADCDAHKLYKVIILDWLRFGGGIAGI
jgi:hypothetical protein